MLLITCWDESGLQAWFNAKPGQMCLLEQPQHCPGVEGRQPNTWCSHKAWYLLLEQKLRSKPEKILESHNLTCKTKTEKHLNCHCNLCKMNRYSQNYLNYMSYIYIDVIGIVLQGDKWIFKRTENSNSFISKFKKWNSFALSIITLVYHLGEGGLTTWTV